MNEGQIMLGKLADRLRQQMLKEVFEVVESCAIQQAGGELDDSVCVSDFKKALKERFGDE